MKDKKVKLSKENKIIMFIFISYLIIMLILFLPEYYRRIHDKVYIVTHNYQIKYENGRWSKIEKNKGYTNKSFQVYNDGKFMGEYNVFYSNSRVNILDKDDNRIPYQGVVFAYSSNIPFNVFNVTNNVEMTESDKAIIDKALSSLKINGFTAANLLQKVDIDLDNDGSNETIYSVSNFYANEDKADKAFSIIFIYKNGEVDIVAQSISDEYNDSRVPSFNIQKVFDMRNDKKYKIIYSQEYFAHPDRECVVIRELKENGKIIRDFCR